MEEINKRLVNLIQGKKNQLFKSVLSTVEGEAKKYNVDPQFFAKYSQGKEEGFSLIRKRLLDQGNDMVRTLEMILGQLELTPQKAIIKFTKEVIERLEKPEEREEEK